MRDGLSECEAERAKIDNGNTSLQYRLLEIQKQERTIQEKLGDLPPFVSRYLLSRDQTDLSEVVKTFGALQQELWGEPPYTTPPELARASAQVEALQEREAQLRSLSRLDELPFRLERE